MAEMCPAEILAKAEYERYGYLEGWPWWRLKEDSPALYQSKIDNQRANIRALADIRFSEAAGKHLVEADWGIDIDVFSGAHHGVLLFMAEEGDSSKTVLSEG